MQLTRYEQALVAWVQAYYAHHELRVNCATLIQVRVLLQHISVIYGKPIGDWQYWCFGNNLSLLTRSCIRDERFSANEVELAKISWRGNY